MFVLACGTSTYLPVERLMLEHVEHPHDPLPRGLRPEHCPQLVRHRPQHLGLGHYTRPHLGVIVARGARFRHRAARPEIIPGK